MAELEWPQARLAMEAEGYVVLQGVIGAPAWQALTAECDLLSTAHERASRKRRRHSSDASDGDGRAAQPGAPGHPVLEPSAVEDPLLDPFEWTAVPDDDPARTRPLPWLELRARAVRGACGMCGDGNASPACVHMAPWEPRTGALARLVLDQLPRLIDRVCGGPTAAVAEEAAAAEGACGVLLLGDHFVRKPPHSRGSYAWHTDANEQLPDRPQCEPYVSAWLPLDRMHEANGCLAVWPRSRAQPPTGREVGADAHHLHDDDDDDDDDDELGDGAGAWFAAHAHQRGEPVLLDRVRPGDCVLFRSDVWHCSGPNRSDSVRRAYQAQFLPSHAHALACPAPLCFAVRPLNRGGPLTPSAAHLIPGA
jgi:ectoine hydroxylase-related dioxygenase (phytanoyl-CoA dioxygenase family)